MQAGSHPALWAIGAALLFGLTTPIAKVLQLPPFELAGLLYLGAGAGLCAIRWIRDRRWAPSGLRRQDLKWLSGSIFFGGIVAPVCLMTGLSRATAATASLLLNFESLFTALLAWFAFKEHAGRRVVVGMLSVFAGGIVLSGLVGGTEVAGSGAGWIVLACLGWALDNNLTRPISGSDALFIAAAKGLVAGTVNFAIALLTGSVVTSATLVAGALSLGLIGYGLSLVLFILSLRGLGAARTGAYFATAPFIGAAFAFAVLREPLTANLLLGGVLMLIGVVLHVTEEHSHEHEHEALTHAHAHVHDEHHQHEHDFPWPAGKAHAHEHTHPPIRHRHPHYPDLHHQHTH
jgi:drug/metabolite transporter (DMT)-like permease